LTRSIKNSQISLLTIDYDIQDDSPQETDVFVLEPASKNMLVKLLKRTNPDVDTNIVDRIASLSDGNSRIALALVQASENQRILERFLMKKYLRDCSGKIMVITKLYMRPQKPAH